MSAYRGRPEVVGPQSEWREWPTAELAVGLPVH